MKSVLLGGLLVVLLWSSAVAGAPGFDEEFQAAEKLYGDTKYEEAAEAYLKVVARFPGQPDLYKAYVKLAEVFFRVKRYEEGVAAAKRVFEYDDRTLSRQGDLSQAAFYLGKNYESLGRFDECQEALLKCALYYPWCCWNSARAVEHLKVINAYTGRYKQSELAAKLYFYVCKPDADTMKEAVEFLTRTLEAVDGNRDRIEQFLLFQKYGPGGPDGKVGTDDDAKNVFESTQPKDDAEREKALEVSRSYYQWEYPTYDQYRKKGYLFLLTGQPKQALVAFQKEYSTCPAADAKALGDATDDVLRALKAITGNLQAGERFLEFQKYGAAGPDGQAGSGDDLRDPVEEVLGAVK
jgi:tetratricopeptide (TPR) repeat protein